MANSVSRTLCKESWETTWILFVTAIIPIMTDMLYYVVNNGTGEEEKIETCPIGGKTGTATKPLNSTYSEDARVSSFLGAFPIDEPQYALFIVVDEPKPREDSFGYATGGWVAAPVFKDIVERVGPLMSKE